MKKPPLHKSFGHAFGGLAEILWKERNFRLEMLGVTANFLFALWLRVDHNHVVLMVVISFMVLSAEIFNTAIEKICDFIQPEKDARIRYIKDISAAAVLVTGLAAGLAGILIYAQYWDKIIENIPLRF